MISNEEEPRLSGIHVHINTTSILQTAMEHQEADVILSKTGFDGNFLLREQTGFDIQLNDLLKGKSLFVFRSDILLSRRETRQHPYGFYSHERARRISQIMTDLGQHAEIRYDNANFIMVPFSPDPLAMFIDLGSFQSLEERKQYTKAQYNWTVRMAKKLETKNPELDTFITLWKPIRSGNLFLSANLTYDSNPFNQDLVQFDLATLRSVLPQYAKAYEAFLTALYIEKGLPVPDKLIFLNIPGRGN